jgi:amino-acid N-acetyltransferase
VRYGLQTHRDFGETPQRMNGSRTGALRDGIEKALPHDLQCICRLLDSAVLPSADISEESLKGFLVYRTSAGVVGAVGLEYYEDAALLRSLVVEKQQVGHGIGKELVAAAERLAAGTAVAAIYLLTTTADRFFETVGFRRLQRELAPASIRGSHQFASLCPASAVLMVKP